MTVRYRDGIHFELDSGRVVADARRAVGAVNVVSHAHADHTFRSAPETVVCSAETAAIATARTGVDFEYADRAPGIELVSAGHVVGSRAAIVEDPASGRRYCYTGDFTTRDRVSLEGFDPAAVDADVLVMETTYGVPAYRFPSHDDLVAAITDWLCDNADRPLFLFGYALGRAQMLQWLAEAATGSDGREILVSESIHAVDRAIEAATDRSLPGRSYDSLRGLDDEIVILPSNQARATWVDRTVDREGGLKAGFSGWAVDEGIRYRGDYDATFPLSDHCDFDELVETVEAIDPEVVYTHHGFDEAFARILESERGYRARPLKRNQRTLEEFR